MKKYLFSMFALLLAVVFSAFNNKPATAKTERDLYWYYVNGSEIITGEVAGDVKYTKAQVFSTVNCPDQTGDDCARGYEEEQTINEAAPAATLSDEHIMESL